MDAATAALVIAQVERVLDAEVAHQKMKLFDTKRLTRNQIVRDIERGDRESGTTDHRTSWNGEILRVDWDRPPTQTQTETKKSMSVTGLQSGAFQAKLAEMRQKIADKQTEALTKIDGAVASGAAKMNAAVDDVVSKADKEVDAALHEFATFTNGGPV